MTTVLARRYMEDSVTINYVDVWISSVRMRTCVWLNFCPAMPGGGLRTFRAKRIVIRLGRRYD